MSVHFFFFFKQKTAYEMRISDWSSDVCSSDLRQRRLEIPRSGNVQPAHLRGLQPDAETDGRPVVPQELAPALVGQQSVRRTAQGDRRERGRAAELPARLYRFARPLYRVGVAQGVLMAATLPLPLRGRACRPARSSGIPETRSAARRVGQAGV